MYMYVSIIILSIFVKLRYLRLKLLKYKENITKILNTFDHNLKNMLLYTGCPKKSGTADIKIIEFGWVILILHVHVCMTISCNSNFQISLDFCDRWAKNYVGNGLSRGVLGKPIVLCQQKTHCSLGFRKNTIWKAIPDIIPRWSVAKIKRNFKMTVF